MEHGVARKHFQAPSVYSWCLFITTKNEYRLYKSACVRLNRLRSGVGLYCSTMYKWDMTFSAACEYGREEQTANHVIATCPIYCYPNWVQDLAQAKKACWRGCPKHAQLFNRKHLSSFTSNLNEEEVSSICLPNAWRPDRHRESSGTTSFLQLVSSTVAWSSNVFSYRTALSRISLHCLLTL